MNEQQNIAVEKGEVSRAQMQEIEAGDFFTIRQIAQKLRYSVAYITDLVQKGRIRAIKPMGGQWRIPASEYNRLITEGIPPLPREATKAPVTEIEVETDKVAPEPKREEKKPWKFPIDFGPLFGERSE